MPEVSKCLRVGEYMHSSSVQRNGVEGSVRVGGEGRFCVVLLIQCVERTLGFSCLPISEVEVGRRPFVHRGVVVVDVNVVRVWHVETWEDVKLVRAVMDVWSPVVLGKMGSVHEAV